jgi:hypothetical protein
MFGRRSKGGGINDGVRTIGRGSGILRAVATASAATDEACLHFIKDVSNYPAITKLREVQKSLVKWFQMGCSPLYRAQVP